MEVESRFPAYDDRRKGKVEGIPGEPLLFLPGLPTSSPFPAYEYWRKGKVEGRPAPDYDENFFGNVFTKEYFCTTSGSDGGKQCQRCINGNPDYHYHILLLKEQGGFTVNDGPLRRFDDPRNRDFMDAIYYSEFPKELDPKVDGTKIHKFTITRDQNYKDSLEVKPQTKRLFEAGTPKEILDAAVADSPNSILIPIGSNSAGTRYYLWPILPKQSGGRTIEI